ncbi:MAG: DEAD/DEAH box helicase, partial [Candidatus Aenigmarchaeota archaeon]|nr:DEAD/DEAH box helicase [Candidatus Aenigmarchaeota archaeon]
MRLDEISEKYPVLRPVIDVIKEKEGISSLFPPQADAVRSGYLDGKNMLLTIPTSSGKTLVAELAALKTVLEKKKKVLYLVPLKALAMEKFNDFKDKYESLGVKTAVSIGNFDGKDQWLKDFDIIVTSVEKADSLLRHKAEWFSDIGLVIADEIHLLDDSSRGPTLEIVLTRIGEISDAQVVGLSATINNRKELAEWLSSVLVESDFRPTVLYEGYAEKG